MSCDVYYFVWLFWDRLDILSHYDLKWRCLSHETILTLDTMNKHRYLSLAAGLVMSTPASVGNSLSWREENTLAGMPGVGATPTILSVSCPSAPSVQLWVSEVLCEGWGKRGVDKVTSMLLLWVMMNMAGRIKVKTENKNTAPSFSAIWFFSTRWLFSLSWK